VRRCDRTTDVSNQEKCLVAVEAIPALAPRTALCVGMTCALVRSHDGRIQSGNWLIAVEAVSALAARTASYVGMIVCAGAIALRTYPVRKMPRRRRGRFCLGCAVPESHGGKYADRSPCRMH